MTTGRKIIRNSFFIIAGNFLNKAVSVALLALLTSYLDPAEFGRLSFVLAYVTFFGIFTDMGINTVTTREMSAGETPSSLGFGDAIVLRLAGAAVTAVLVPITVHALGYTEEVVTLTLAATFLLFFSFRGLFFRNVFEIPFQVKLRMGYPAVINFINEILTLFSVVLLVRAKAPLFDIVLAICLVNIPCFAIEAFFSTRLLRPSFKADFHRLKRLLKESLPLGAAMLLEGVFLITPVFVLSKFSPEESLGLYSLPLRLVASLWIIPVAGMVSMLPRMSADAHISGDALGESVLKGLKAMLAIGLPMALVTDYYSGTLIDAFTGGRYTGAAPALSIMIWGTFMYFMNTVFYYSFTAAGLQRINTAVWSLTSALSLIMSIVLIPRLHHYGAALSFTVPLTAGALLNLSYSRTRLKINALPILSKFIIAALVAAIILIALPFKSVATVIIGLAVYLSILLYQKTISYSEWHEWLNGRETK